ncbi:hypothetical protein C1I95_19625 [Micromonospora craterilacus]|uniref:Uncharacterized protein n=1 Tax=Micromonospora craterilacus TaxID=1655439 RepID=A0A2W2EEW1_9ACTN|nr:hypothetical protein [Micromonospora craterilacus]PZG15419.1 hypothetical protein C1I95_19625 [Micromonospora craterilacus]
MDGMQFMVSWWMAVRQQCERILPAEPAYRLRGTRQADAYLFVWAAHNLRTAAELVRRSAPLDVQEQIQSTIEDFDTRAPDVRKLRNALSHFDAFVYGEGRPQKGREAAHLGVYTVAHDGDYELVVSLAVGEPVLRLSVEKTTEAANALFRAVGLAVDELPLPSLRDVANWNE